MKRSNSALIQCPLFVDPVSPIKGIARIDDDEESKDGRQQAAGD